MAVGPVRIIWNKARNPTRHVSDALGIERWQLRRAIHLIKARNNLSPQDRVVIFSDGTVKDVGGNEIGNILDE
jgi:hypothetical protein